MSRSLAERWYELVLLTYPKHYRAEYGADIMGALMAGTRRLPSIRETVVLILEGVGERARGSAADRVPWWADGVHLGVTVIAVANLTYALMDRAGPAWIAVSTVLMLTLMRGWARVSLPLAVAVAVSTGRVMMFGGDVTAWGSGLLGPSYHNWVSLIPYGLLAAGAAVLAVRRPRGLRRRSWFWPAIPVAAVLVSYVLDGPYGELWAVVRAGLEAGFLLVAVWATAVARSPRWITAAAMYVLPIQVTAAVYTQSGALDRAYHVLLAALLLSVTAALWLGTGGRRDAHPPPLAER
ncbi:hypothetical protein [Nonomuraea sp. NEAU-A123]|uniref:hypothetical protein n=1 Tax=Nonomuraea sp. NEAU-A123 TaxID=2839649 RepID=UPI001BE4B5EC|nr:hypothetical protein [Nonomuraea sp. NEAU-A123]MBT2235671.1 hypothetical protein [Nonomuraea sp. NEAU-A123]